MSTNLYDGQLVRVWHDESAANAVSPAINRAFYEQHSIQYITNGTETLKVETSLDNEHWVTLDADQDPNTIVDYIRHIQWLRFTKGPTDTVTVLVGGAATHGT
jgi:hypothetical protein